MTVAVERVAVGVFKRRLAVEEFDDAARRRNAREDRLNHGREDHSGIALERVVHLQAAEHHPSPEGES